MLFYEKKAWRAKYFSVFAFFIVFSPSAVEFLYAEEDRVLECQRAVVHEKDGAVGRAFNFFYHAAVIRIEDVCQRRSFLDMVAHVGHTVEDAGAARLHVDQLRFVENDRLITCILYAVFYYLRLFHKTEDGVGGLCDGLVFDM